jgi:hypothetical protein
VGTDPGMPYSAVVHQAQGMVSVQAGCSMDRALGLMQHTADTNETALHEVAKEVLARELSYYQPGQDTDDIRDSNEISDSGGLS